MACLFGEHLNERFEEEEKRFYNDESKVNYFHTCSRNIVRSIFSSSNNEDIIFFLHKTIQRTHHFCLKVNLSRDNGTKIVGYAMYNVNNMLSAKIIHENNNLNTIDVPGPEYDIEIKDYQCEDLFSANGFKVTLFEPIVTRFKRTDCIMNFGL